MNNGVFYLLVYTFVYYGDLVPALDSKNTIGFKLTVVISSILCIFYTMFSCCLLLDGSIYLVLTFGY